MIGWLLLWLGALALAMSLWASVARARAPVADSGHTPDAPVLRSEIHVPAVPKGFNNYDAGWIQFAYPPGIRQVLQPLIDKAPEIRTALAEQLGQRVLEKVKVRVARTPSEMAALAPEGAPFPRYASGVAYSQLGLILLTVEPVHPNDRHDLREIFRHELTHVALYDAVGGHHVPRWLNEGYAVHASGEQAMTRLQALWTATLAGTLLRLKDLDAGFPSRETQASIAYAQSADLVRFLTRKHEAHRFRALISGTRDGRSFDQSLERAYNTSVSQLEYEWRQDVARRYTFWPVLFSGGVVWIGAIGLFAWGWRRRKKRDRAILERWANEEATEAALAPERLSDDSRVHIVLARNARLGSSRLDVDVPKVEHDGQWHTLH